MWPARPAVASQDPLRMAERLAEPKLWHMQAASEHIKRRKMTNVH